LETIKISEVGNKKTNKIEKTETSKTQQQKQTPKVSTTKFNNLPLPPMPSSNPEPVEKTNKITANQISQSHP